MNITKSVFVCIVLLIAVSCGHKQHVFETDWKKEKLQGKVQILREKRFFLDSTGVLQDSSSWNKIDSFPDLVIKFNNRGYYLLHADGGTTVYTYSDQNSRLLKVTYEGMGSSETTFHYDFKGRIKQLVYLAKYDKRDSAVTQYVKYDNRGNVLKIVHVDVNDTNDFYRTYVYDRFDRVIEEKEFGLNNNTPRTQLTNKYDTNGNKIYSEFKYLDGRKWGWVSAASYDDKGNELKDESSYIDNGKQWTDIWEYRYKYDKLGNWTQRIISINGKDKYVYRRKIAYW